MNVIIFKVLFYRLYRMLVKFTKKDYLSLSIFNPCGYSLIYADDLKLKEMDPLNHYIKYGIYNGYCNGNNPQKNLFFPKGYIFQYRNIIKKNKKYKNPWCHYLYCGRFNGFNNGYFPSIDVFFEKGYVMEYPDIKEFDETPWEHYVKFGYKEGRDNGLNPPLNLFFKEGYLELYDDVKKSGIDPWVHYLFHGNKEGRDNGLNPALSIFFKEGYLEIHDDVRALGEDPWIHYITKGKQLGYGNGWNGYEKIFNTLVYLHKYDDVQQTGLDPWYHYVMFGKAEGKIAKKNYELEYNLIKNSYYFDADFYKNHYEDLFKNNDIDLVHHFMVYGYKEKRMPSPNFSTRDYAAFYKLGDDVNPLLHYELIGKYTTTYL